MRERERSVCPQCHKDVPREALKCDHCGRTGLVSHATIDTVSNLHVDYDDYDDYNIEAKLRFLRQDAADALGVYWSLRDVYPGVTKEQVNVAALGYLNAHTKYTLACLEAKRGDILPYV